MPPTAPPVRVNRRAETRIESGHPWIFRSDVETAENIPPGSVVEVQGPRSRFLGMAHWSSTSQIALRLLARERRTIDSGFYTERLQAAAAFRERVVEGSNSYRLVHAEADRLPALIVDRYGDSLVVQTLDQGMDRAKNEILDCLEQMFSPKAIVLRNDAPVRRKEDLPLEKAIARGALDAPALVRMNGLEWEADLLEGQKTGVFLDQRENYVAAQRWAFGRALDCFTSTGGFALHLAASCASVEGVDSSAFALDQARQNRDRNGIVNVEFREADVFELLAGYDRSGQRFDTVVLDPPAFAKSRSNADPALRAYKEINRRALKLLSASGVLITCSCSFHVSEADLLEAVAAAALEAGKTLRVLERRTQAIDHPVLLTVPETMYLKYLCFGSA